MQTIYLSSTTNNFQHGYLNTNGQNVEGDVVVGDGNQVFYRGSNGHLHTYSYQNGWNYGQLTNNSQNNQKVKNDCGAVAVGAGNQVFYRNTDNKIRVAYWTAANGWLNVFIVSNAPASQDVGGDVVVDAANNNRVVYRGTDGKLHAYEYNNGAWGHLILNNTVNVSSDCGAISIGASGEIFFKGTGNEMNTLKFNGTNWVHTSLGNANISNASNVAVLPNVGGTGLNQAVYRGTNDGRMRIWFPTSSGFGHDWIENSWQAPDIHNSKGSIAIAPNNHVFYRDKDGLLNRYHWEHDFTKSSANNDYFSMEETPLSPTLPKVERTSNILNVVVRPNPVETRFALDIYSETDKEAAQIILYDLLGREVLRKKTVLSKGGNTLKLNVEHLQSGMYYLKVMDSEGRFLSETIMKM
jgi:hypothetical protein